MRLVLAVGVALLVLAPLAAMALRGPRGIAPRSRGRLILEGLVVLAIFVLVVVVTVALRS